MKIKPITDFSFAKSYRDFWKLKIDFDVVDQVEGRTVSGTLTLCENIRNDEYRKPDAPYLYLRVGECDEERRLNNLAYELHPADRDARDAYRKEHVLPLTMRRQALTSALELVAQDEILKKVVKALPKGALKLFDFYMGEPPIESE